MFPCTVTSLNDYTHHDQSYFIYMHTHSLHMILQQILNVVLLHLGIF